MKSINLRDSFQRFYLEGLELIEVVAPLDPWLEKIETAKKKGWAKVFVHGNKGSVEIWGKRGIERGGAHPSG